MSKFVINQNQFSDLLNIKYKIFFPLKTFVNKEQFLKILAKYNYDNNFFPFPIFFGLNKKNYIKFKNCNKLDLIYKKRKIAVVNNLNFYSIDKEYFGKKIFGKKFKNHPYFKKFNKENYKFLNFNILKFFKKGVSNNVFIAPSQILKKIKNLKIAAFHTRNVPHLAHQWIHKLLIQRFDGLLIQPMVGQYKSGEYKDEIILKLNKLAINSYRKKKVFVFPFFSYPRYGGPREAALHALVRKNYGCKYFWVGRDHAGIKNFYGIYDSQKFCKKIEQKLKIKIIAEKEPYFCKKLSKIVNYCKCKKNCKIKISGTTIRNKIKRNVKIPTTLMSKLISKKLTKKSLI